MPSEERPRQMLSLSSLRFVSLSLALVALPTAALAQDAAPRKTLGVDAAVVLPVGDYGELATLGVGAFARFEFPLQPQLAITARAGAIYHLMDEEAGDASLLLVPIYGGVRYSLGAGGQGLYLAGEVGLTWGRISADTGFGSASDTDTELGITLGAGFKTGKLDLRGQLFIPDLGEADDLGLMATVGFDFATF
jgi:hypothetical protein